MTKEMKQIYIDLLDKKILSIGTDGFLYVEPSKAHLIQLNGVIHINDVTTGMGFDMPPHPVQSRSL